MVAHCSRSLPRPARRIRRRSAPGSWMCTASPRRIRTFGKGVSAGYAALSGIAAPERIVDVMANGSGSFIHAQTFSHHPVACAAGVATMRYLKQHKLVERCAQMGRVLHERLRFLTDLLHVGDVRGRGLLGGIEFVEDKASRVPFLRSAKFAERFADAALDTGITVWPNVGHADGTTGDAALIAPPFIITEPEIDEIVGRLTIALERTISKLAVRA